MAPLPPLSVSPEGKLPEVIVHETYGVVPPAAIRKAELFFAYCELIVPVGNDVVVTVSVEVTLMVRLAVVVLLNESFTCAVKVNDPGAVGEVKLIAPAPLSVSPVGNAPLATDQVYPVPEPPVAERNVGGYVVPTYPVGSWLEVVRIESAEAVILNVLLTPLHPHGA